MNEHDNRQLEAMVGQIRAFQQDRIDLSWLVTSIEALLNALEAMSPQWVEDFRSQWAILEELYSLTVVRGQPLSTASQEEIYQAIRTMEGMIDKAKSA